MDHYVVLIDKYRNELVSTQASAYDSAFKTPETITMHYLRSLQNALPIINVKCPPAPLVEAKGDGLTNDTYVINAMIAYCSENGGGVVYVPKGTYLISKLYLKDNVVLRGDGMTTTFKLINNAGQYINPIEINHVSNARIENLLIDGNRIKNTTNYVSGIYVLSADNITIANTVVENVNGDGIYLGYTGYLAKNITLNNVTIRNSARNELVIANAKNVLAKDCTIISKDAFAATIDFEKHDTSDMISDITFENFDVITGPQPIKLVTNNKPGGTDNVVLRNLKLEGINAGIQINDFDNVTFERITGRYIEIVGSQNIMINGTSLSGFGGTGIYAYEDNSSRYVTNLMIDNVDIYDCEKHGILLQNVKNAYIINSNIHDNAQAGLGIYYACNNVNVINSILTDTRDGSSKTQPHAVKFVSKTHSNINIIGCYTEGNAKGEYDGLVSNLTFRFGNSSNRNALTFITPGGTASHTVTYGKGYALTGGDSLAVKGPALTNQYTAAYDTIPRESVYKNFMDGILQYKNLAGTVHNSQIKLIR